LISLFAEKGVLSPITVLINRVRNSCSNDSSKVPLAQEFSQFFDLSRIMHGGQGSVQAINHRGRGGT